MKTKFLEIKALQGFNCNTIEEAEKICNKLHKLGYPIYKGTYTEEEGFIGADRYKNILFNGEIWVGYRIESEKPLNIKRFETKHKLLNKSYGGQLKKFPKEIVQEMLGEQVRQGNPLDITVFEINPMALKIDKGFNWRNSVKGYNYWCTDIFKKFKNNEAKTENKFKLKKGMGFLSPNIQYTTGIYKQLEKLGYPIYDGSYNNGVLISSFLDIKYDGLRFVGSHRDGIKEQLNINDLPKCLVSLPTINGYEGIVENSYIIYGCAFLNIDWFTSSKNREIESLVTSNGVAITKEKMEQIRKYLKSTGKI